jgi:putative phage-type endonuclease
MSEEIIQRSEAWFQQRVGKVTASRISDVVAKTKTGWGAIRHNYASQLIIERLTGEKAESYTNAEMQHGIDTEPQARAAYEFQTGFSVKEVGFIQHKTIELSGASPDGYVNEDGLTEIKCPNSATHIESLLGEPIDKKYMLQMQWQMACTGRKWCDFVSFDNRMPIELQLKIIHVTRDDAIISDLEKEVKVFLQEVSDKLEKLKGLI